VALVLDHLGARLVACKTLNQAWRAKRPLIRFLVQAFIVVRTLLKAPPRQAPEKCPNRAFPQSHPHLKLFRGRGVRADVGGGDGTSSGYVAKKRRENFGHRPLTSSPLFSSALTAEIQTRHFPQIELVPFEDLKPWLDLAQRQRGGARQRQ
jgi:hypothetical protein